MRARCTAAIGGNSLSRTVWRRGTVTPRYAAACACAAPRQRRSAEAATLPLTPLSRTRLTPVRLAQAAQAAALDLAQRVSSGFSNVLHGDSALGAAASAQLQVRAREGREACASVRKRERPFVVARSGGRGRAGARRELAARARAAWWAWRAAHAPRGGHGRSLQARARARARMRAASPWAPLWVRLSGASRLIMRAVSRRALGRVARKLSDLPRH